MNTRYPRIILAGTHSGAGKTTITLGITLALKKKGLKVQSFKAGPDYIDPSYYKSCRNLDSWLLSKDVVLELFSRQAKKADISIIEGVMGLYDGIGNTEEGSTAKLSKILRSPVILIVDAGTMSRSAGAVVLGYEKFDRKVSIAGVILNNIGSQTHYNSIVDSIGINIPVLGFMPREEVLKLPERHLGLIPAGERRLRERYLRRLLNVVEKNININRLIKISQSAPNLPSYKKTVFGDKVKKNLVTIGIARDRAFNFYYEDNLDILRHFGARIVEFSPLADKKLPQGVDGLYIGGGFPEIFASMLAKNISFKKDIYRLARNGLPIYAECGGLMYLMKELEGYPMAGVFNGKVKIGNGLQRFGYVEAEALENNILSKKGEKNRGHLFHWSYIKNISGDDYFVKRNVLASYVHLHFASNTNLAKNFISACKEYHDKRRFSV